MVAAVTAATVECGSTTRTNPPDGGANAAAIDAAGPMDVGSMPAAEGGPYVATDAGLPVDTRPAPPLWNPPVALGSPGWRESTTPLCEPYYGSDRELNIWSDPRGVFAVFGTTCPLQELNPCGSSGSSIQFNDGTGWRAIYLTDSSFTGVLNLNGFAGGPEILAGDSCGFSFIGNGGVPTCTTPQGLAFSLYPPQAFGVQWPTAYAISGPQLLQYGDAGWTPRGTLAGPGMALWADTQTVVATSQNQAYEAVDGGVLAALPNVPAGDYLSAWGFAQNDVWLGNAVGQLVHYNGNSWTAIAASASGSAVSHLWGADGQVYFVTDLEFGRWNGQSVETLIAAPPVAGSNAYTLFRGLWGNSATEVFVALVDTTFEQYACGGEFVLWFDGTQFHRF